MLPTKASGYRSIAIRRPQPSGGAGFSRDHLERAGRALTASRETHTLGFRLPFAFAGVVVQPDLAWIAPMERCKTGW